jgi:hypothetical protein
LGELKDTKSSAEKGYEKLEKLWREIEGIDVKNLDKVAFIDDSGLINKIRFIIRGKTGSYKYALLTQLLAKVVDPNVNALALQKSAGIPGAFDARSFCKETVVKFERNYLENILGGSSDPYVSKPLRHKMISLDIIEEIRDKEGWKALHEVLKKVEGKRDVEFVRNVLKQTLLEVRKLQAEVWASMQISISRSPTLTELVDAINKFLAKPSEGARVQVIVYALLRVINNRIKAFKDIEVAKSTVADKFAGKVTDIECISESGKVEIGVSVTEILDDNKLEGELNKCVGKGVGKFILIAHKIDLSQDARAKLDNFMRSNKIDIIIEDLAGFVKIFTTLLNSKMRSDLIKEIAEALKELGYLSHLRDWIEILKNMELVMSKQQNNSALKNGLRRNPP